MSEVKKEVLKTLTSRNLNAINQGTKRTHKFKLDFADINEEYTGYYVVRHPSQMDRLQIGVLKSQLLGGVLEVDTMTDNIATIISTLDTITVSKPEWFDVYDDKLEYEIIESVYYEYIDWLGTFRKKPTRDTNTTDSGNRPSEV